VVTLKDQQILAIDIALYVFMVLFFDYNI